MISRYPFQISWSWWNKCHLSQATCYAIPSIRPWWNWVCNRHVSTENSPWPAQICVNIYQVAWAIVDEWAVVALVDGFIGYFPFEALRVDSQCVHAIPASWTLKSEINMIARSTDIFQSPEGIPVTVPDLVDASSWYGCPLSNYFRGGQCN